MTHRFGTFLRIPQAAVKLNIEISTLRDLITRGDILMVITSDEVQALPSFQFKDRELQPLMQKTLRILHHSVPDGWGTLYWMTAPIDSFNGRTPVQILTTGNPDEVAQLQEIARLDAQGWAAASPPTEKDQNP